MMDIYYGHTYGLKTKVKHGRGWMWFHYSMENFTR